MRRLLAFALIALPIAAYAVDPWEGLSVVHVDHSCFGDVTVMYDPKLVVSLPNKVTVDPDSEMKEVEVMSVRLSLPSDPLIVAYSEGASCDPTFLIFKSFADRVDAKPSGDIWGLTLIIPGDGHLYCSGHTNNFFSQTKKFGAGTNSGTNRVRTGTNRVRASVIARTNRVRASVIAMSRNILSVAGLCGTTPLRNRERAMLRGLR